MATARYQHFKGQGFEHPEGVPFAASQYFHSQGAAFIYQDTSGHCAGALNATAGLTGWYTGVGFSPSAPGFLAPSTGDEVLTSSTAGTKYKAMMASYADVFFVPTTAAYAAARLGETCDISGAASNATGAKQQAILGTTSTDVLRVLGGVVGDSEAYVSINTFQLDT
jgi:hypothetical protein